MKCARICRELLWLARFGEFGPSSQPHLDHLVDCAACRDEVGYDRAMVQQLRIALAERIGGMTPSPDAWERIRRRAQAQEPATTRLWIWSTAILGRLRTATAVAGTGLALVLAMNMEVVPVATPSASEPETAPATTTLQQDPHVLTERPPLAVRSDQRSIGGSIRQDPEGLLTQVDTRVVSRPVVASDEPIEDPPVTEVRVSFRSLVSQELISLDAAPVVSAEPVGVARIVSQPGEPF